MSSPVHDDADKQILHALPWVSDPKSQDETNRLQEQVIEAAQHLERASGDQAHAQPRPQIAAGFQLLTTRSSEGTSDAEETTRRIWSALKPELMPAPPPDDMRFVGIGMVIGTAAAVVVAAAVALVVSNAVHMPTTSASVSNEDVAAKSEPFPSSTLTDLAKVGAAQAKMAPAEEPPAPAGIAVAAVQTNDTAPPKFAEPVAIPAPQPAAAPAPAAIPEARPAAAAPSPIPEARPTMSLTRDEITAMLKRGRDLLAAGDVASGRLMLSHLAEAGDAEACLLLAGTFDPVVLAKLRVVGVQPDPARAHAWYARAAELGSLEARQRLQQSAAR